VRQFFRVTVVRTLVTFLVVVVVVVGGVHGFVVVVVVVGADWPYMTPVPFSADRTAVYSLFLLPELSNSNGEPEERHESESRTPQTVIPAQRATFMQSLVMFEYQLTLLFPSTSSSVTCTSTPSFANSDIVVR